MDKSCFSHIHSMRSYGCMCSYSSFIETKNSWPTNTSRIFSVLNNNRGVDYDRCCSSVMLTHSPVVVTIAVLDKHTPQKIQPPPSSFQMPAVADGTCHNRSRTKQLLEFQCLCNEWRWWFVVFTPISSLPYAKYKTDKRNYFKKKDNLLGSSL